MMKHKSYNELITIPSFEERLKYLKINGIVSDPTFGSKRYINQSFYKSYEWQEARRKAIVRDMGLDLACQNRDISGVILVHHINPLTEEDIILGRRCLFDLNNLICTSKETHNLIHYGDLKTLVPAYTPRTPGDTCLWRK